MKVSEAGELVKFILAAFPTQRQRMSAEDVIGMSSAYASLLSDVDAGAARAAAIRVMRTAKFVPTVAEIREAIGVVSNGERRHGIDAWGDVLRLRSFRDLGAVDDVDPLVMQVCRSFGWIEWRKLFRGDREIEQWHVVTSENEAADRARFAELYDKLATSARREAQASSGAGAKALPVANGEASALAAGSFDADALVTSVAANLTGRPR